ncbi:helix-turn-helix transcriptional regulator [Nocardia crassostreae]|uniref:helix-turn-helix transcriptional regulator n=1 Tax=Nocardia crassostreae TaxID=53428 RepID=UPI0008379234|nr:helix-turn-helix transcriptional regulator [Nocardia crassostreae]
MADSSRLVRQRDGIPVFGYHTDPATPPVTVVRLDGGHHEEHRHIHEFPALVYLPRSGVVAVIAAGRVVDPATVPADDHAFVIFFDPAALDDPASAPQLGHPLLFPFRHRQSGGLLRLELPTERRELWNLAITGLETELAQRRDGFRRAITAHLTLLLVDLARLSADVVTDPRTDDPLLTQVYDIIEQHYPDPLSLRDIARHTGLPDPGYFARLFRSEHGISPRDWRAASR